MSADDMKKAANEIHVSQPSNEDDFFFRVLPLCELGFSQPFRVFCRKWKAFSVIAISASILVAITQYLLGRVSGNATVAVVPAYWVLGVIIGLAESAAAKFVSEVYTKQPACLGALPQVAAYALMPLVEYSVLTVGFIVLVALPLFIWLGRPIALLITTIASSFLVVVTFLVPPIMVVERKGIMESIARSIPLMAANFAPVAVILFVYGFAFWFITTNVLLLMQGIQEDEKSFTAVFFVLMCLVIFVYALFIESESILRTVLYFQIRIKDEGLTRDKLLEEIESLNPYYNAADMEAKQQQAATDEENQAKFLERAGFTFAAACNALIVANSTTTIPHPDEYKWAHDAEKALFGS